MSCVDAWKRDSRFRGAGALALAARRLKCLEAATGNEREAMDRKRTLRLGVATAVFAGFGGLGVFGLFAGSAANAVSAPDKYTLKVPGGLAFSEFKGYESWQLVSVSAGKLMAAILGNPTTIEAFRAGIPGNGKPFPDGAKMAKIHWVPKVNESYPGPPTLPTTQHDVDFMVKDSKRFPDSGGWGYAAFEHDTASDTFTPATTADHPPQANDARCGFACHTKVAARDYVFTEYAKR